MSDFFNESALNNFQPWIPQSTPATSSDYRPPSAMVYDNNVYAPQQVFTDLTAYFTAFQSESFYRYPQASNVSEPHILPTIYKSPRACYSPISVDFSPSSTTLASPMRTEPTLRLCLAESENNNLPSALTFSLNNVDTPSEPIHEIPATMQMRSPQIERNIQLLEPSHGTKRVSEGQIRNVESEMQRECEMHKPASPAASLVQASAAELEEAYLADTDEEMTGTATDDEEEQQVEPNTASTAQYIRPTGSMLDSDWPAIHRHVSYIDAIAHVYCEYPGNYVPMDQVGGQTSHLPVLERRQDMKTVHETTEAMKEDNIKRAEIKKKRGGQVYRCAYCGFIFKTGHKADCERHMHGNATRKATCFQYKMILAKNGGAKNLKKLQPVPYMQGVEFEYPTVESLRI